MLRLAITGVTPAPIAAMTQQYIAVSANPITTRAIAYDWKRAAPRNVLDVSMSAHYPSSNGPGSEKPSIDSIFA